jgi:protein-S-isoprenylcysteine O-methyltransferase Ste14
LRNIKYKTIDQYLEKMELLPEFEIGLWNAWIFMIWLVLSPILSNIIIKEKDISKRLRASAPMKYEAFLNIISMVAVFGGVVYSIFLPIQFNTIWFYIGFVIFLFGLVIDLSVLYTLRKAEFDKPFTGGPYKFSRHPIYMSLILIIISVSIMSVSLILLIFLIVLLIHLLLAVPAEEKFCLEKYGKYYQEYIRKTPRWIGIPKSGKRK